MGDLSVLAETLESFRKNLSRNEYLRAKRITNIIQEKLIGMRLGIRSSPQGKTALNTKSIGTQNKCCMKHIVVAPVTATHSQSFRASKLLWMSKV